MIVKNSLNDLFWAFIKKGIDLLKNNGYLGFLTEDSILDAVGGDTLRTFMLKENVILGIKHTGKFPGAGVHTVMTILRKQKLDDYDFVLENWVKETSSTLKKSFILNHHKQIINLNWTNQNNSTESESIISHIEKNAEDLEKIIFLQQGIIVQWGTGKTLTKRKEECIFKKKKSSLVPYLEGKDVDRYKFPKEHDWLDYRPDKHWRPRMRETFESTKLLVRRIASESLVCLLDDGYYFVDNTLFTGNKWNELLPLKRKYSRIFLKMEKALNTSLEKLAEIAKLFEYGYLLGVLNSRIMTYYFEQKFQTKSLEVLTKCKIKHTTNENQKIVAVIAQMVQKMYSNDLDAIFMDKEILDSLIYEIYLDNMLNTNLLKMILPMIENIEQRMCVDDVDYLVEKSLDLSKDHKILDEIKKIKENKFIKMFEEIRQYDKINYDF